MKRTNDIYVFADWRELGKQTFVGVLHSEMVRGNEVFSFFYDESWLSGKSSVMLDPDILPFVGHQFLPGNKINFGVFLDSAPDRWGRILMKRREAIIAREEDRKPEPLTEADYLLGVFDGTRMGGLRFKQEPDGDFLDSNKELATPPWTNIRDLEYASLQFEKDDSIDDPEYRKWLRMLLEPGSSLGGARPKANIMDKDQHLWIAKFPSGRDSRDMGAWEKVVNDMAGMCGINVPESQANIYSFTQHTFISKRFDRDNEGRRIHFSSAMTMLGQTDGADYNSGISYLDLVAFISKVGVNVDANLEELFRRVVFNIAISNCDDHLRNHGFLLTDKGWELSPAYDLNPDNKGGGLKLNISEDDNSLDFDLARSVAGMYRLSDQKASEIIEQVRDVVSGWESHAQNIGISRSEREEMATAFRY